YPTATNSNSFKRRQALYSSIKSVWGPISRVVGPAITVNATPGDEILALKAIEIAKPGDIIVVAGNNNSSSSFWGGVMSTMAKTRGVQALVTEGFIRDVEQCRDTKFPIWARGVSPIAPNMDVPPGELNLPISIGNVLIHPGDLIVADEDGVAVVPREKIKETGNAVKERLEKEEEWLEEIKNTKQMILRDRVESCLSNRSVEYLD